jgi:hypothetical protein
MKIDRLKLFCLALLIASLATLLVTDNRAVNTVNAFSTGPPAGRTGAPGESTCLACHAGIANQWPNLFTIQAPESYVPGQTYQITVQHMSFDPTRMRWGFELTALALSDNTRAGTLVNVDAFTSLITGSGPFPARQYIRHTSAGTFAGQANGASWTFDWTAPSSDVGPVRLYAAGNEANNNNANSGDMIYTTEVTILPAAAAEDEKKTEVHARRGYSRSHSETLHTRGFESLSRTARGGRR